MSSGAAVCRLRVRFGRRGPAAKFSQLEQIRLLRQLALSSGLPVAVSAAKHPLPKMSFGPAITVGYESECEYADISLTAQLPAAEAVRVLAKSCDGTGFSVEEAHKVPVNFPSVEALVNVAAYEIKGDFSTAPEPLEHFLSRGSLVIEKVKPSGEKESIDARPLIRVMEVSQEGTLKLLLRFGPKKNLKPERIVQAWLDRPVCVSEGGCSIIRKQLFWESAQGELRAP